MCGIAGIWNLNESPVNPEGLKRFTDSLYHRGPDGGGYYIDPKYNSFGLGHRRLSILDLSERGAQPMSYADGRYHIAYNGEVFNFIELRTQLESKGHVFHSDTDTEVVLACYIEWGKDCLFKFNGMWSFVIWDSFERKLFLARDRWGIKPLHYLYLEDKIFALASETIAFKNLDGFERTVSDENLSRCLDDADSLEGYGYTIYNNLYQVLPGHYIELGKNKKLQQKRWWDTLSHLRSVPTSYKEQVEEFRGVFEDSCKIRLRSDVSVASALSGGLDSSSVYCMLHHMMRNNPGFERTPDNWQRAYTAYFPNTPNDEKLFAEKVVAHIKGDASYVIPDYKNLVTDIMNTTRLFDTVGATPILCASDVYKAMNRDNIKVSMDGHGVDEMLMGYSSLVMSAYQTAIENGDGVFANDLLQTYASLFRPEQQNTAKQKLEKYGMAFQPTFAKKVYKRFIPAFIKGIYRNHHHSIQQTKENTWNNKSIYSPLPSLSDTAIDITSLSSADKMMYEYFHASSMCVNLRDFDRASMQSSVEIRMPFMDWRLVTYVFSLPLSSKVGQGFTKRILRDSMKGILPEDIRQRKLKIGLSAPVKNWFEDQLKQFLLDELSSKRFSESSIWNGKLIKANMERGIVNNSISVGEANKLWLYLNAHILINLK